MLSGAAKAQEASEDWDLAADPERRLTLATLDFGSNQIALRCQSGALDLLLTGVPPVDVDVRPVRISFGPIRDERQNWLTAPGQPVASPAEAARLARQLRAGGELDIVLEPTGAAAGARRYRLPVPASAASVDSVLTACSVPLADDWDLLPRFETSPTWVNQPIPEFPVLAMERGIDAGVVEFACMVAGEGALDTCRILSESPPGVGFGRSGFRALERARVRLPGDGRAGETGVITFTLRFKAT